MANQNPIKSSNCPNCGAPLPPRKSRCDYCGSFLILPDTYREPEYYPMVTGRMNMSGIAFRRPMAMGTGVF